MLAGNNSILQKATTAKENTERAEIVENAKMDVLSEITKNKGNDLQESQLKDVLKEYFINSEIPEELPSDLSTLELTTLSNKYKIKVSEIYDGTFKKTNKSTGKTVAELYDGKNNPSEENYNENAMHIGDWVEYDAGNWTETKETPNWDTYGDPSLEFGGYTAGQSRNTNASGIFEVSGEKYEGWRIFDISENTITLISAGCPEGYYDTSGNGYNTERIFTGTTNGRIVEDRPSTPRDWTIYENNYAINNTARTIRKNDLNTWYNKYVDNATSSDEWDIPNDINNKLNSIVNIRYDYLLTDAYDDYDTPRTFIMYARWSRSISYNDGEDDGVYGVRILVNLKNNTRFNETPTKIQKDGFSYNKWTISE